jgi:hypothetical protein
MGVIYKGVQHSVRPKVLKIVAMKITVWLSVHPTIHQTTLHHKKIICFPHSLVLNCKW